MNPHPQSSDELHAVVPMNVLRVSKARLAPILSSSARVQLSVAMLVDVLAALRKVHRIHRVTVVSADLAARQVARSSGASFLWEGKRRGLNKGVRLAIRESVRKGATAVLIIHADIPLITARGILRFLNRAEGYAVALTPSKDGTGTNALYLRPTGAIQPAFGKNSFRRHLALASQKSILCRVVRSRGIGFDLDEPPDLNRLMRMRSLNNETSRILRKIKHGVSSGRKGLYA
jgi:2-phospho-L-lactate guanylyltransferase